jgi:hypothetical protein
MRTIEIDPAKAPTVKRIFELYASGSYSLSALRKSLQLGEARADLAKSYLATILKNRFYCIRLRLAADAQIKMITSLMTVAPAMRNAANLPSTWVHP